MQLSSQQISNNYQLCYEYVSKILRKGLDNKCNKLFIDNQELIDLTQTVIGHESIVKLIQSFPFNELNYDLYIKAAIDEVKKSFFPDVNKKRYFSINDERYEFLENVFSSEKVYQEVEQNDTNFDVVCEFLPVELREYFRHKLIVNHPNILNTVIRIPASKNQKYSYQKELIRKIYLFKKFYPEGKISFYDQNEYKLKLNKQRVIDIFLKVYLGIEKFFPKNFLKINGKRRSAILVRFLVEEILELQPQNILAQKVETLFIKHKLQNVYRFFNYSFNRVLGNAYPEIIHPWVNSRTSTEFWKNRENRINAVKWLVEDQMNYSPDELYKAKINRTDFSKNGLSFLFNTYYNSVSSALLEAYPAKRLWELGKVPFSFWTNENSANAIRWVFNTKGWGLAELPYRYQTKELNRKIFSEYGLATLFEKKFNCNIFSAISTAFPDMFYPWQFGNVPSEYWTNHQNIYNASKWIAEKEGINEENIVSSIRDGELTFSEIEKYRIGQALKKKSKGSLEKIYGLWFWKDYSAFLDEKRILRKIKNQNKRFIKLNVIRTVLYGLFAGEVMRNNCRQQKVYRRISQRISNSYNY